MRRLAMVLLICLILVGVLLACSKKANKDTGKAANRAVEALNQPVTITIFQNMPEYTDAFNEYIKEYKKVKPNVTINVEITQADYPTLLKTKINAGNVPDVFVTTAGGEIEAYAEYSYDLSKEPLADAMMDSVKTSMSYNGKIYGFPIKANTFGIIYNKDIFEAAGIVGTPKTFSQLKQVAEKLEAFGVRPFTTGYKEWWVHKHIFQHFVDAAQPNDVQGLVNAFVAGEIKVADYPTMNEDYFDFLALTLKYGDAKPLETDLSAQISAFATGEAAMMLGQGPWVEVDMLKVNPKLKMGLMGYTVNEDPENTFIITGADQALRINKDSKNLKEVLELYNWLFTSDYGKEWFTNIAQVIPPIKEGTMPQLQIPMAMEEILKREETGDIAIIYSLDSFHQVFGEIIQGYIANAFTKEEAISEIEKAWIELGIAK